MGTIRLRSMMWFVAGLTLAVAMLWTSTVWRAEALPGPNESTVVPVNPQERVLDSRDPVNLGLPGPFVSQVSQKLQITGSIPTATGTKTVVPTGATGVLLNVTGFNPTADGFISIRPGDATGAPTTSSINILAGQTVPNAVQVSLPTTGANAGQIDITYDALGQTGPFTDMFIDVVGYTTNTGLQDVNTQIGNRYTKDESDARYVAYRPIVMSQGTSLFGNPAGAIQVFGNSASNTTGSGFGNLPLDGPAKLGAVDYGLVSVTYCANITAPAFITNFTVSGTSGAPVTVTPVIDLTDRTTTGCYSLTVNDKTGTSFTAAFAFAGGAGGSVIITSVTTTWAPKTDIPKQPAASGSVDPANSGS